MEIWKMTLSEFTGELEDAGPTTASVDMFLALLNSPPWHRGQESELNGHPGFATAPLSRGTEPANLSHQVLLRREGDDWIVDGLYMDDTAIVRTSVGRRGLGTELVLRCEENRVRPEKRIVTVSGKATLLKAHRVAVERALAAGLPVPPNVRAIYNL